MGKQGCRYIDKRCLKSYTNQDVLVNHVQKCCQQEITSIKLNEESHLYWKDHFHNNPLYFRIIADFEAHIELDNFSIGNKATNIYKQNPTPNGYYIISELDYVLENGYYESPLGFNNLDWFVDEVIKLEKKMAPYFKNTTKDIIMTQEDMEDFDNINIC